MKKIFFLVLLSVFCLKVNAQKKKKPVKKAPKIEILAKVDNITIQIIKNNLNLYITNGKLKDSINIKQIGAIVPTDFILKSFNAKGNNLYLLTYNEKTLVQNPNKTEDITEINSEIFDISTKTKIYSNIQKITKISEKVFLDRLKNASETQEKMRNEGYIFSLLPDGDILLSTKLKSSKLTYDLIQKKYIELKKKK